MNKQLFLIILVLITNIPTTKTTFPIKISTSTTSPPTTTTNTISISTVDKPTTPVANKTTKSSLNNIIILAVVLGIFGLLFIVIAAVCCFYKRRQKAPLMVSEKLYHLQTNPSPYVLDLTKNHVFQQHYEELQKIEIENSYQKIEPHSSKSIKNIDTFGKNKNKNAVEPTVSSTSSSTKEQYYLCLKPDYEIPSKTIYS